MVYNEKYIVSYDRLSYEEEYPITIDILKDYLNISTSITRYDKLLEEISWIALDYAECYTEKSFIKQKRKVSVKGKIPQILELKFSPIKSILSIQGYDSNNELITFIDNIDFKLDNLGESIIFTNQIPCSYLDVIYNTGYNHRNNFSIPSCIKHGLLQHIFFIYNKSYDSSFFDMIKNIYEPFRNYNLF